MKQWLLAGLLLLSGIVIGACQSRSAKPETELQQLGAWLTGNFNSGEQALHDAGYFDIRLAAAIIWKEREDGIWIYLEQASAESIRRPYRQRIYHLYEPQPGQFVSDVYTLPDPDSAVGSWEHPDMLDEFGPGDLSLRMGCSVFLQMNDEQQYVGGTQGKDCNSSLNEASYATSEVVVTANGIDSWDRGFNAADEQVWGAQEGPYQFRRKE